MLLVTTSMVPGIVVAGGVTGQATEWTQLANNAELINLLEKSGVQIDNQLTQIGQLAEQIQNQLNIYNNMLQNTAQLPHHIWGKVEADLEQLQGIVSQGEGIAFSMGNADDILKQRFKSFAELKSSLPNGESFSSGYQTWSDTNRDTIAGTALNVPIMFQTGRESTMFLARSSGAAHSPGTAKSAWRICSRREICRRPCAAMRTP